MTNPSTRLAREVVGTLLAAGVTEVVLAPGSRNAPLSFAVYDAGEAGLLRLHTRIDERTAGFLALGLAKTGGPAAVICTSGTAVANLHPAVLEAAHAGVPLVVVTADRPARLRGTNANQTTDQVGIFGDAVPFLDLSADPADSAGLPELVARESPTVPVPATSTSSSTIPSCRPTAGPPTPRAGRSGPASRQLWPREPSLRAPGQWWSRVTTPARRRGSWPRVPTGRSSPSPPAAPARATTPCAATGCCSTATSAGRSSG